MPSRAVIDHFLVQHRLAFIGVLHDPKEFSATVYEVLPAHGYELHPVNPHAERIGDDVCVPAVGDLPDGLDGAIVMVPAEASLGVVEACIEKGIPRIWFLGTRAPGRRRCPPTPCTSAASTASRWSTGPAR